MDPESKLFFLTLIGLAVIFLPVSAYAWYLHWQDLQDEKKFPIVDE